MNKSYKAFIFDMDGLEQRQTVVRNFQGFSGENIRQERFASAAEVVQRQTVTTAGDVAGTDHRCRESCQ